MPFSSLASTASSSNARRVPRASWSNASKAWDDFKDSFDQINDVNSVSSDDVAVRASTQSLDMCAVLFRKSDGQWYKEVRPDKTYLDSTGKYYVYQFPKSPDGYYYHQIGCYLYKSSLPSSGTYGFTGSLIEFNIDFRATGAAMGITSRSSNVQEVVKYSSATHTLENAALHTISANITIPSNVYSLFWYMEWPEKMTDKMDIMTPVQNPYKFTFKKLDGASSVGPAADSTPSSDSVIADNSSTIAENSNRQVEQGDSIIELIKNTIQTISSQLESFWNQLAGEFTNLYNKMNQQHAEKLQSDQDTRDTITEESEKSRNFIVDGIINGLKSLFIPSDDYFKAWFDDMYAFFNDRFGFLMFPVDLLVQMVNLYLNADSSFAGVPFPEFKWIDGTVVIPAQNVQFTFLETDWGQGIQQKLYFVGNIIMIGALLSLMHRKFEEVLRN